MSIPLSWSGTKPGTRPEGVGTELSEAKVKKSRGMRVIPTESGQMGVFRQPQH